MGAQGEDILLSAQAIKHFPYSVEAKNQESIQIWKAIKQAEENAKDLTRSNELIQENDRFMMEFIL